MGIACSEPHHRPLILSPSLQEYVPRWRPVKGCGLKALEGELEGTGSGPSFISWDLILSLPPFPSLRNEVRKSYPASDSRIKYYNIRETLSWL